MEFAISENSADAMSHDDESVLSVEIGCGVKLQWRDNI